VQVWAIQLIPSIQALKYSLKSNISSKPFYYYTGSRHGQILHSMKEKIKDKKDLKE
jgi:hypothetical protein